MKSHDALTTTFIITVWVLVLGGLLFLTSASSILGRTKFNDPYFYLKHQFLNGVVLGAIGFFLTYKIPYYKYKKLIPFLFIFSFFLTILLFTPLGMEVNNARRWLNLKFISFQPNELLKITFLLYLSLWLSRKTEKEKNSLITAIAFLAMLAVIGIAMLLQPATSSFFILVAASAIAFFVSGAKLKNIILVSVLIVFLCVTTFFIIKKISPQDYRIQRIEHYFSFKKSGDNLKDELNKDYQLNQSLMAIGSGGLWGVGFGNAVSKYNNYLPEPIGDSIFAIIAQEFGLIGGAVLLLIYIVLFLQGIKIAANTTDQFGKIAAVGITSLIMIQTFVHIGAVSGQLILTGQPLPLISYGGTNLAILLTSLGIVANISKNS